MRKMLAVMLIATMMLTAFLALGSAADVTKSTTTTTTPGPDVTKSTTNTTSTTPVSETKTTATTTSTTPSPEPTSTTKSTTTTSTPGFEAPFALFGILALAFIARRARN